MSRNIIAIIGIFLLLSRTSLCQVNLANGAAQQEFPLISYSDNKSGLNFNVTLSYYSGNGLVANEVAGNVGTGWNLTAGGFIMRMQNGEPDDQLQFAGDGSATSISKFPFGYLYNPNWQSGCNAGLTRYTVFRNPTAYKTHNIVKGDTEQDKFIFFFEGRAGMFIIGKDFKVTTLGDSRLKFQVLTADMKGQGIRTTIDKFVVTTEQGIKYTFADKMLNKICRYKLARMGADGSFQFVNGNPDDGAYVLNRFAGEELQGNEYPYIVNGWYLTEVENTNNGSKIQLQYESYNTDMVVGKNISHSRDLGSGTKGKTVNKGREQINMFLNDPDYANSIAYDEAMLNKFGAQSVSVTYIRSIATGKRLKQLIFPNGNSAVFTYSTTQRADVPGDAALEQISYFTSHGLIRNFELKYGYFYKTTIRDYYSSFNSSERKFARLCLLSIQKRGTGEDAAFEPPYYFSYYTGTPTKTSMDDMVPPQNTVAIDHYGYYNGSNSDQSLSEDHDILRNDGRAFFKTVLPKYRNPKSGYAKNGLLKSVTYPYGGTLTYEYAQILTTTRILIITLQTVVGGVSVSKTTYYDGENSSKNIVKTYKYVDEAGRSTRWGDERAAYYSFSTIDYTIKQKSRYKYPGVEYPEMATSIDWSKVIRNAIVGAAIQTAGMLAVQLIFGSLVANVVGVVLFIAGVIYSLIKRNQQPEYHRYTLSNQNIMMQNPLPLLYSRVEVAENSPQGYNGKTVYQFTDYRDYPILSRDYKWPWVPRQRAATWLYGLPKKEIVYDKNDQVVKETGNSYDPITTPIGGFNISCKCATHKRTSLDEDDWRRMYYTEFHRDRYDFMVPQYYFNYTGRAVLNLTTVSMKNASGVFNTDVTKVITDPATLLQKGSIVNQDENKLRQTITFYPTDYKVPGPLQTLKARNAIHVPVATETWLVKNPAVSGNNYQNVLIDASVTEFKEITVNGINVVKPWKVYKLNSKQPVPASVIGEFNGNVLLRKPEYFRVTIEYVYDNRANLVQTITDESTESYIYDFSDNYQTASVANAAFGDIAYAGFEADGKGNWNYDQAFVKSTGGLTGYKCFYLGPDPTVGTTSTITRTGLDAAKKYFVTVWSKSQQPVLVNGQAGTLLYTTGQWKLYRYEATGVTEVTLTGNGLIDELRLYPEGSLMATNAYKEGIGRITECDANNRLLFYEYDGLGRMKLIKDQEGNVIKTFEYNYKKQ